MNPGHVETTRAAYDATADIYVRLIGTELQEATEAPVDRALLGAFVELVAAHPARRVADLGCGPGRVAAFLSRRGLDVIGVDLSPAMVAAARDAHPGITFEEGRLTAVPIADASLAGAVCWYSIINTPPADLGAVAAELVRILSPGGQLLVAFQAGSGEGVHRSEIEGTPVSLTSYRHSPEDVASCLTAVGLRVHTRIVREPELAHESTPQAFVLARRPD